MRHASILRIARDVPELAAVEARNFMSQMISMMAPGIGLIELLCIDLAERDGRMTVVRPVPHTPAANSDVHTGDVIVEIGGRATTSYQRD
jgi:C-terminal processing protease CtpA/Prc